MTQNEQLFEDVYDLLRGTLLLDDEAKDDEWAKLTRKHYKQAKKNWCKNLLNKNIEWDKNKNMITVGTKKPFKIKLIN